MEKRKIETMDAIERSKYDFVHQQDEEMEVCFTEVVVPVSKIIEIVKQLVRDGSDCGGLEIAQNKSINNAKKVCYCGSIRVALWAFKKAEYISVIKGEIALMPSCMHVDIEREYGSGSEYKIASDENHKRKIDIADEVFILNVGGYIGESTRSEIDYALSIGKPVRYLEYVDKDKEGARAYLEQEGIDPDDVFKRGMEIINAHIGRTKPTPPFSA